MDTWKSGAKSPQKVTTAGFPTTHSIDRRLFVNSPLKVKRQCRDAYFGKNLFVFIRLVQYTRRKYKQSHASSFYWNSLPVGTLPWWQFHAISNLSFSSCAISVSPFTRGSGRPVQSGQLVPPSKKNNWSWSQNLHMALMSDRCDGNGIDSPLYCIHNQHYVNRWGKNQRIMLDDKTWFLTLTPCYKIVPARLPFTPFLKAV